MHAPAVSSFEVQWKGERALVIGHGTLHWIESLGEGISRARIHGRPIVVRARRGGEALQLTGGARRPLKKWLQEADMPPWERAGLPLVWVGDELAAVPGIGIAARFACVADESGWRLEWRPQHGAPRVS